MVLFPDTDPHMAEGAAVMLFYQVGELFQAYAVGKSRKSISAMMDIAPDYANVEQPDGTLEQVFPDDIAVGTVIVVKPASACPSTASSSKARRSSIPPPLPASRSPARPKPETISSAAAST